MVIPGRPTNAMVIWYGRLPDGSECRVLMEQNNDVDNPACPWFEVKNSDGSGEWMSAASASSQLAILRAAVKHWHKCGLFAPMA